MEGGDLTHHGVGLGQPGGVDQALSELHAELSVQGEVVVRGQEVQVNVFNLAPCAIVIQGG